MTVRIQVGCRIAHLLAAVTPTVEGALVTPFVGVRVGLTPLFDHVAARVSQGLFTAFLRRDLLPFDNVEDRRSNHDRRLPTPGQEPLLAKAHC